MLSEKEKQKELKKLKDEFPCWKIVQRSLHCEYDPDGEQPRLTKGTHVAKCYPDHRVPLDYPPGFHAYLEKPTLTRLEEIRDFIIIKCWARKEDVIGIGSIPYLGSKPLAVAVSKITRK